MAFKNPPRPNPEGKWRATLDNVPTAYKVSQIGNYQEHIHQDSNGYLYAVVVNDLGLGQNVVTLYSNIATATEVDLNFPTGPTMALISATTIAFGYPYNSVSSITELSSVLFGRKLYVAMLYTDIVYGRVCELFEFDIGTNACTHLRYYAPQSLGESNYRSVDIDCFYGTGKAFLWMSMIEYLGDDYRYIWWQHPLPHEPQSDGSDEDVVLAEMLGADENQDNKYLAIRHCFEDRQCFSISHGYIDTTAEQSGAYLSVPSGGYIYQGFNGWRLPNDLLPLHVHTTLGAPLTAEYHPLPFQVQSTVSPREILVAGLYDINFNQKYGADMLLRWRRGTDLASTSWELWFGVREQGVITYSAMILSIDYANLGVTDIEDELENTGIYPECGITVNEKGITFVYALFPSLLNTPIGSGGPGCLDDDPYYDIWMLHYGDNNWYQPNMKDWQVVEDGFKNQTGYRYLSTPNRIDGGRQPKFERLYILTHDTLGLGTGFTIHTRHPGNV